MDALPEEVLIHIFTYLPQSYILSLLLTCKRFSQVINHSHLLLKRLVVKFSKDTANLEWIGSRYYTNVAIYDGGLEKFLKVQEFLGTSVTKLAILDRNLNTSDIFGILKTCPNLTNLEIHENFNIDVEVPTEQLLTYNLKSLKIKGGFDILKFLKNSQTSQLHAYWSSRASHQSPGLAEFLTSQTNLTSLTLENFSEFSFQFPQNLIENIKFRLKKFAIKSCSCFYVFKLKSFLELHVETLTQIELDSYAYHESQLLKSFKNLKTLKFGTEFLNVCSVEPIKFFIPFPLLNLNNNAFGLEVLPQIKVLEVSHWNRDFINYSKYLPNVEELTINGSKSEFFVDLDGFDKLIFLKISAKKITKGLKFPDSCKYFNIFIENRSL